MKITLKAVLVAGIMFFGLHSKDYAANDANPPRIFKSNSSVQTPDRGKDLYVKNCSACHQVTGAGIPGAFPPLASSDFLNKDVNRTIKTVLEGISGDIIVNGAKFNSTMPAQGNLEDKDVADIINYVYANWGNSKKKVTPAMVKAQRKK